MRRVRIIPTLLLRNNRLIKTARFQNPTYIGDPINAVRIYNEKEVDEIILLDIAATKEERSPDFVAIKAIASEAFMPAGYGGGIGKLDDILRVISSGFEKVILNTAAYYNPGLISEGANAIGSQSIVVSIDVKKNFFGKYRVYVGCGKNNTGEDVVVYAKRMEDAGAGEIILNSINRDGTLTGYDLELISNVSSKIKVPLVVLGGAAKIADFKNAIHHGASAVAAGSMFVYKTSSKGILISYPPQHQLHEELFATL